MEPTTNRQLRPEPSGVDAGGSCYCSNKQPLGWDQRRPFACLKPGQAYYDRLDFLPLGASNGLFLPVHTPPAQLPLPSILLADASLEKIGAGIETLKIAKAIAANPGITHFITTPPYVRSPDRIHGQPS
jgi:hypothetical protein